MVGHFAPRCRLEYSRLIYDWRGHSQPQASMSRILVSTRLLRKRSGAGSAGCAKRSQTLSPLRPAMAKSHQGLLLIEPACSRLRAAKALGFPLPHGSGAVTRRGVAKRSSRPCGLTALETCGRRGVKMCEGDGAARRGASHFDENCVLGRLRLRCPISLPYRTWWEISATYFKGAASVPEFKTSENFR